MTLHVLGARYLYSYVPYDDWSYWLWGKTVSGYFGFTRNHYDRLVHFAYGLLLVYPASEVLSRHCHVSLRVGGWLAVQFILATSALYEIGEWALAISVAPDWAEHYNGQQGDRWDAQKDAGRGGRGGWSGREKNRELAAAAWRLHGLTRIIRRPRPGHDRAEAGSPTRKQGKTALLPRLRVGLPSAG